MDDDWENLVIETGVDTLLNYLAENQKAPVSEISDDLGVSEDRIKEWADALDEENFIQKKYSARKGMILKYTQENKEEAEKRLEEIRKEIGQKTEKVEQELQTREDEIEDAKKQLNQMTEKLEENREKEEQVKKKLEKLEELESELKEKLRKQEEKEKKIHSQSVDLLSRIDSALNRIDEAERKAEEFKEEKTEIRKKMKALKKLEKHAEKASEVEEKLEQIEKQEKKTESIFKSFKHKISRILPGKEDLRCEEILSGNIEEVKQRVNEMDDPDYRKLLEKERQEQNRKTLVRWLEEQTDA